MDPTITSLLVGGILTALGWMGKSFRESYKEAKAGKKKDADRIREDRDRFHHLFFVWRDHAYKLRGLAHLAGVQNLPDPPPEGRVDE